MAKLPILSPKEVLRVLLGAGFYIHHQTGSHARLFHSTRPDRVTVPIHPGDLPAFVLMSIIRQAGLTKEEFIGLLDQ
ncbi:MAG: type II toxin-antitoxin system HicA family toxin [Bryobacteraceae bacterium]